MKSFRWATSVELHSLLPTARVPAAVATPVARAHGHAATHARGRDPRRRRWRRMDKAHARPWVYAAVVVVTVMLVVGLSVAGWGVAEAGRLLPGARRRARASG